MSMSAFSPGHTVSGALDVSEDVQGTSGPFQGLSQQHQAHLADCKVIELFLHAVMHRNSQGLGGNIKPHVEFQLSCPQGPVEILPGSPPPACSSPSFLFVYLLKK